MQTKAIKTTISFFLLLVINVINIYTALSIRQTEKNIISTLEHSFNIAYILITDQVNVATV
jgi:hypothetical protein